LSDSASSDVVASRTENAIYKALGLRFIEPELREGSGELAAADAGSLPRPVRVGDVRGDLHVHSTWSGDGRSSLEDMVAAAAARGLEYVAITEHAEDLAINGLSRDEVREEGEVLAGLQRRHDSLELLHGAELNIGPDGSLDYDEEFLLGFDWCVASVHSHFDLPAAVQTERLITAMRSPAVGAIGHLTGRRIGRRPGIDIDVDAVLGAAADTGTAIEINSHLDRLDAPAEVLRRGAAIEGLRFVISTDAHHTAELANVRWGVRQASRGWVDRRRVVNTWPKPRFLSWIAAKRQS
jgi:DNA polymerase (family 10)